MKTRILNRINVLIGSLLAMLGIGTGCISKYGAPPVVCEYGAPYVELTVKGVVTDENDNPLSHIQMDLKYESEGTILNYFGDDVHFYTDANGQWQIRTDIDDYGLALWHDSVWVFATDTSDVYAPDSIKAPLTVDRTQQNEWKTGVATAETDFKLKTKENK